MDVFRRKLGHILSQDPGLQQLRMSLMRDSYLLTHKRKLVKQMGQQLRNFTAMLGPLAQRMSHFAGENVFGVLLD